jgi:hypothetical protein
MPRAADEKGDDAQLLPPIRDGETAQLREPIVEGKETRPPPRYNEGTLIEAMQNAWRFVDDEVLRVGCSLSTRRPVGATPGGRKCVVRGIHTIADPIMVVITLGWLSWSSSNKWPTMSAARIAASLRCSRASGTSPRFHKGS